MVTTMISSPSAAGASWSSNSPVTPSARVYASTADEISGAPTTHSSSYAIAHSGLPIAGERDGPICIHESGLIRPSLNTPRMETVVLAACGNAGSYEAVNGPLSHPHDKAAEHETRTKIGLT